MRTLWYLDSYGTPKYSPWLILYLKHVHAHMEISIMPLVCDRCKHLRCGYKVKCSQHWTSNAFYMMFVISIWRLVCSPTNGSKVDWFCKLIPLKTITQMPVYNNDIYPLFPSATYKLMLITWTCSLYKIMDLSFRTFSVEFDLFPVWRSLVWMISVSFP